MFVAVEQADNAHHKKVQVNHMAGDAGEDEIAIISM
jgi:hypothetical protein